MLILINKVKKYIYFDFDNNKNPPSNKGKNFNEIYYLTPQNVSFLKY